MCSWVLIANGKENSENPGRCTMVPPCQLFEIHGSKFKLYPVCHLSQASVLRITHSVFFFGVGKDPFNGFFAPCI
jgi:hypothetical protein